jgi:hypothetical protein
MTRRTSTPHKLLPVASVLAAVLLAGCAQGNSGDVQQGPPTTPEPPSTSAAKPPTTKSKPSTTKAKPPKRKPAAPGLCTSGDLKLSLGRGDAGAGTVWRPLQFTNKSSSSCVIQGFPGVSYVAGDDGHQVGAAAYRDGTKGAPVTLPPGSTAYAAVGFTQVGNYDPADCKPTKVRGLRVYPPQETHSMYLANSGTGCANSDVADYHLKVQTIRPGSG